MSALAAANAALELAAPGELVSTLSFALESTLGAEQVSVLLADYHLATLRPVDGSADPVTIDASWQGRVFAAQRPAVRTVEGTVDGTAPDGRFEVGLPMTVRGDRRGVLVVLLPVSPSPEVVAELAQIATAVGRELCVADRVTDSFARVRRARPLTVAAELQWAMLPGVSFRGEGFRVAGQLEPAYSVAGDAYDWSLDGARLSLLACDGMGHGVPASLATTVALTALRNARRGMLPLVDQVALADQALYAHFGGSQYVSGLFMELHVPTGRLGMVGTGATALWLLRGGELSEIALDAQLALGMFEESHYDEHWLMLEPGDRLVVVSDGVGAARDGQAGLAVEPTVRDTRLLDADEAVRHVMRSLTAHHNSEPLDDDAVALCLDWTGPVER